MYSGGVKQFLRLPRSQRRLEREGHICLSSDLFICAVIVVVVVDFWLPRIKQCVCDDPLFGAARTGGVSGDERIL